MHDKCTSKSNLIYRCALVQSCFKISSFLSPPPLRWTCPLSDYADESVFIKTKSLSHPQVSWVKFLQLFLVLPKRNVSQSFTVLRNAFRDPWAMLFPVPPQHGWLPLPPPLSPHPSYPSLLWTVESFFLRQNLFWKTFPMKEFSLCFLYSGTRYRKHHFSLISYLTCFL